jgi:outer membrane protein assembly factor BamB
LKWKFKGDGRASTSPAISADGIIYINFSYFAPGNNYASSHLYAINPEGTMKWQFTAPHGLGGSSVAIGSDGTIYTGSTDFLLYALTPDGRVKWKLAAEKGAGLCTAPAIGADGTIYFGSIDYSLYAVTPDGTPRWRFQTGKPGNGDPSSSSPAISGDGTIYVGSASDGNLYALNPDGKLKWKFANAVSIDSSPAIGADGTVYFGAGDGNLYAVGAAVGLQPSR